MTKIESEQAIDVLVAVALESFEGMRTPDVTDRDCFALSVDAILEHVYARRAAEEADEARCAPSFAAMRDLATMILGLSDVEITQAGQRRAQLRRHAHAPRGRSERRIR